MPVLLVSDTSVLVDLERAGVLEAVFRLPIEFAVPDLLYERELRTWPGRNLKEAGLLVLALDADGVELAQEYRRRERRLSLPDAIGEGNESFRRATCTRRARPHVVRTRV